MKLRGLIKLDLQVIWFMHGGEQVEADTLFVPLCNRDIILLFGVFAVFFSVQDGGGFLRGVAC